MIARPEWFGRRKYTGWGVTPRTWQGGVYLLVVIGALVALQALPFWSPTQRSWITGAWIVFLLLDIIPIMRLVSKDERERQHEAIAERNAAWAMTVVLSIGIVGEIMLGALQERVAIPWVAGTALLIGLVVKATSNLYLERTR